MEKYQNNIVDKVKLPIRENIMLTREKLRLDKYPEIKIKLGTEPGKLKLDITVTYCILPKGTENIDSLLFVFKSVLLRKKELVWSWYGSW